MNTRPPSCSRPRRFLLLGGAAIAAVIVVTLFGLHHRHGPAEPAETERPPSVAVAAVTRRDLSEELAVQAEFRPYQEVELHAKVSGYLQKINVDFGDRVKAGDLIATLEVPELKDELDQAVAAEQRAEADYAAAHLENTRLLGVNQSQPNLIAQQELDDAAVKDRAGAAAVSAAKAEAAKYRTLMAYTRITAPFDGVVTARYVDAGALIQTGSAPALPLIRLSENQLLRLDFPVSVSYAGGIAVGDAVEIRLEGSPATLHAKITRFARRISMATRTMETEVEVPNPDLKLIPGMYATVVLKLDRRPAALALPVEAINATSSSTVYVVGPDHRIEERPVKLGLESADAYEVLAGLRAGNLVVVGSRAGIQPGEKVKPQLVETAILP
jgi:RND family efflux transporter MFP subunit